MFKLPEELTIVNVDECKSQFINYVESNDNVVFDGSKVSRVDTIGIQLLLSMVNYIDSKNKTLSWQEQPPIIQQSIKQLGINEVILNQYFHE